MYLCISEIVHAQHAVFRFDKGTQTSTRDADQKQELVLPRELYASRRALMLAQSHHWMRVSVRCRGVK